jgi:hypothetical protein
LGRKEYEEEEVLSMLAPSKRRDSAEITGTTLETSPEESALNLYPIFYRSP